MTTYYVDGVSGSDSNAGTSFGAAFQTIGKLASVVAAGDEGRICATGTYTLTSAVAWAVAGDTTSGPITVTGANATGAVDGTRPTITSSSSGVHLFTLNAAHYSYFKNLKFTHTGAARGDAIRSVTGITNIVLVQNCVIDGAAIGVNGASFTMNYVVIEACEIANCTSHAVEATVDGWRLLDSYVHDNAGAGYRVQFGGVHEVRRTIFDTNGAYGVDVSSTLNVAVSVHSCTFYGQTNDGLRNQCSAANQSRPTVIENCVFYGNGGYGVNYSAASGDNLTVVNRNNAYGSNTSGARNNLSVGASDVSLSGDPFTNAAGGDFSLNNTAGGGAACRAAGSPGAFPGGTTNGYLDIGAVQHQESGGGGTAGARLVGPSALVTPGG